MVAVFAVLGQAGSIDFTVPRRLGGTRRLLLLLLLFLWLLVVPAVEMNSTRLRDIGDVLAIASRGI